MLASLSIRDIVLIEKLDLEFGDGLTVVTGETGAGKSILLDSLSLVLGSRADRNLVRRGADAGSVVAEFLLPEGHDACNFLRDEGLDDGGGTVVVRRQVGADGRSRAHVNDTPVSQSLLAKLGAFLVEFHAQNAERGLIDPSGHRDLLDRFAGALVERDAVTQCYNALKDARGAVAELEARISKARADEEYLRHALEELDDIDPQAGEEESLADERSRMMQGEKLVDDIAGFDTALRGEGGVEEQLHGVLRRVSRLAGEADAVFDGLADGLDRTAVELGNALSVLDDVRRAFEFDPQALEQCETRLFELRRLARKHNVSCDLLVEMRATIAAQLQELDNNDTALATAQRHVAEMEKAYSDAAAKLTDKRQKGAALLAKAVNGELPPLKLENASFRVRIEQMPGDLSESAHGLDRVAFEVKTNASTPFGDLNKIASGGEMARFVLALKVSLARDSRIPVMVFDEVDQGIGGATADAVGERLSALAAGAQVLVVTHSPQVAARGSQHVKIRKSDEGHITRTHVQELGEDERQEEVARMLAGAEVTSEARAAARRLLAS